MKRAILAGLGAIALAVTGSTVAEAQLGGLIRDNVPGVKLPDILGGKQPVSTNIKDAKYADPSKDSFNPGTARSMTELERSGDGGFVLQAGYFSMIAQTYCLRAGTYGPTGGDGYLYAPVKGSQHKIVTAILRNSTNRPEIDQRDIQVLLWAVVARAKFEDLNSRLKLVASQLLTTRELASMNRNALDVLTNRQLNQVTGGLPEPVARIARAEADMRRMLASGGSNYGDLEAAAVLAGVAPRGAGSIDVPASRWSKHPDGYWVRYDPQGYKRTHVEIYVEPGSKAVGRVYDPATSVAVPGNTSKQRIGQSGRVYS
ncbi:hypothetical protein [Pontixanthobacter aquaemixtae]|uniref:Uncharacterized protein n=1 Tax=Pontixanthobacter aquaemixtae TaxID=1958940 RepID=A0A844ZRI0_9SPHN|nr:hypothetical protein [Pontixanthobacter aquaemixtae]MXO90465.1 hypothetical protein [Pontixanthobacter aquaemixtae]